VPAFDGNTVDEVFENVLHYDKVLAELWPQIPEEVISADGRAFINRLICEPAQRLGKNGLEDFKADKFFKDFDWEHILDQTPPFVPQLQGDDDVSFFADRKVSAAPDSNAPGLDVPTLIAST